MKGKVAVTASPLIVWFCGFSTLINVLANWFESLQLYPFYDIIADPVKGTKQNKLSSLWNESQVGSCETTTSFQLVEENRAQRQRGCREHITAPERNSSMAKEPTGITEAQSFSSLALREPMATKTGHGHFLPLSQCPDLWQWVTMMEIKIWQDGN